MLKEDPYHAQIFAARLTPHRSLNPRNFRLLLIVFAVSVFFTTLPFLILGAWPVAGFMGLDVLIFWLAFRANFRAARAYEDVSVSPAEFAVAKVSAKGERAEWRFNPIWVRLDRQEDEEFGLEKLRVMSRGRELEIAGFLDPCSKADFAHELSLALAEARQGARWS